ncbi:MAG TPA: LytR C-terminal domain-containing protein [Longimicrobium sp.]
MSRSKAKRKPAGGRLQTFGIFATLVLVAVLIGSLVAGVMKGRSRAALPPAASDSPAAAGADADAVPVGRVRVQVLNASGRPGLAREATRVLRDRGFDVKEFGNGQGFPPDSSVVLDRVGRIEVARQVADAVGIRRVTARPDSNLYLDATVVLGRDWRAPKVP